MKDATSLDLMHDIVEPLPAEWWPPAPGWYLVILISVVAALWLFYTLYRRWQNNKYVREALSQLEENQSSAAISELLRRTALHRTSREELASLTGQQWTLWLEKSSPAAMPENVREELGNAIYSSQQMERASDELKTFAAAWIEHHRAEAISTSSQDSKPNRGNPEC